jgi:hypothetical protein
MNPDAGPEFTTSLPDRRGAKPLVTSVLPRLPGSCGSGEIRFSRWEG